MQVDEDRERASAIHDDDSSSSNSSNSSNSSPASHLTFIPLPSSSAGDTTSRQIRDIDKRIKEAGQGNGLISKLTHHSKRRRTRNR